MLIFFLALKYELVQVHFFAHVSCSSEHLLNLLTWWDVSEQSTLEHSKIANSSSQPLPSLLINCLIETEKDKSNAIVHVSTQPVATCLAL